MADRYLNLKITKDIFLKKRIHNHFYLLRCNCSEGANVRLDNGACLSQSDRKSTTPFVCFLTTDVKAIWNPWMHTLQIQSKKV